MGWERKRGMLNQFNEFLMTGKSQFETNNCDLKKIPKIQEKRVSFPLNLKIYLERYKNRECPKKKVRQKY